MLAEHPWLIVAIPAGMAAVGLLVTRVAIWALFNPLTFVGIRPIGWQGYLPARAHKIAPPVVQQILQRVGTVRDLYQAMDPDRIAEHLVMSLQPRMTEVVEDAVLDVDAMLWDELPPADQRAIVASIERELPELTANLLAAFDEKLEDLVDIDHLTRVWLIEDKPMLNRLLRSVGRTSFTVLSNIGLLGGLLTGLVMVAVLGVLPQWWALPVTGLLVMLAAGWAARRAVFGWPAPRRFGRWNLHGVLYRDQDRGSRAGVRLFTTEILTVGRFVRETMRGPRGDQVHALLEEHVGPVIHRAVELARPALRDSRSDAEIDRIEHALLDAAIAVALSPLDEQTFNRERQVVVEDVFLNRMLDLTGPEYEELVRPAVRDAEWLYVAVVAAAGLFGGLGIGLLLTLL